MAFDHVRSRLPSSPAAVPLLSADETVTLNIRPQQPTFFFAANTQHDNAGDALINRELLKLLRPFGRVQVARAGAPIDFLAQLSLAQGELRFESRVHLWAHAFVSGLAARMGGRARPFLVLTPGDPGGVMNGEVLLRGLPMIILYLAGVRIIRLGVSLSRMSSGRVKFEAFMSKFHAHIGVRDSRSLSLAASYDFRNVDYFPDLALRLPPIETRQAQQSKGSLRIAISFRDDNLAEAEKRALIAYLDRAIRTLNQSFVLSIDCIAQVGSDAAFMRELAIRYGPSSAVRMINEQDLGLLAPIYERADLVLANRLHALLYGAAHGAVPLGLLFPHTNVKIIALLEDIGLAEHWRDVTLEEKPKIIPLLERRRAVMNALRRSGRIIDQRAEVLFGEQEP